MLQYFRRLLKPLQSAPGSEKKVTGQVDTAQHDHGVGCGRIGATREENDQFTSLAEMKDVRAFWAHSEALCGALGTRETPIPGKSASQNTKMASKRRDSERQGH